jgi:membrane protein
VFSREAVEDIIAPTVSDILTNARAEVVSIGFVISLWSGSSAMSSFVDAITRAHEQYLLRNPVWQRLLALLLYAWGW